MWPLSMFISTITRYQMTHLAMCSIYSYQAPYKMSSNHIKGRNRGTIWLSYMHYFPWTLIQPRAKSRLQNGWSCPSGLCLDHSSSNHRIFSERAIHTIPEASLEMSCLGRFILKVFLLISCGEQWSKWQRYRVGLPECAIVRSSNKRLSSSQFRNSRSLALLQKPRKKKRKEKKAAVWEWREEGEEYLVADEFPYEQGGSSDGVMGLQGGAVLKERKAKMEGS